MLRGDYVLHPSNAPFAELVPEVEICSAPEAWNGRPVIPGHPTSGETANTPENLQARAFGTLFNAMYDFDDHFLKAEAWLSLSRAEEVGSDATSIIARINAGTPVEVSTGVFVAVEEVSGIHDGKQYGGIWHRPLPDHLAMLPEGVEGACSLNAGCGAPRLNTSTSVLTAQEESDMKLLDRLLGNSHTAPSVDESAEKVSRNLAGPDGPSDYDIREMLEEVLTTKVAGYRWVSEIYKKVVVCEVYRDRMWKMYRFPYSIAEGVASVGEGVEVERGYVPVAGAAPLATLEQNAGAYEAGDTTILKTACGCQKGNTGDGQAAHLHNEGDQPMKNTKELAGRLIGLSASPYQETDRPTLEALPEAALEATIAAFEAKTPVEGEKPKEGEAPAVVAPVIATPVVQNAAAPALTQLTTEQFLAIAPDNVKRMLAEADRFAERQRGQLIRTLAAAQSHLDEAALKTRTLTQLEEYAAMLGVSLDGPDTAPLDYGARSLGAGGDLAVDQLGSSKSGKAIDPWAAGVEAKRVELAAPRKH